MSRDGQLGVGIVGPGRVGPVLGLALAGAGHALRAISRGSDEDRIAAMLPGVPIRDVPDVVGASDLVVLAVPGDQLAGLVAGLAEIGAWRAGQLVLHTHPAFGVDVLAPAVAQGAIPLAVHPAISFTGTTIDLAELASGYAAVTAPAPVLPIAQALAVEMGCEPVVVAEHDRAAYAEAIATATHFSRSIVVQATGILSGIGVENPGGFLSALVRSTVDQALTAASADVAAVPGDDGALE